MVCVSLSVNLAPRLEQPSSRNRSRTLKIPVMDRAQSKCDSGSRFLDPRRSMRVAELVRVEAVGAAGDADEEAGVFLETGSSRFWKDYSWPELESSINRSSKWLVSVLFALVIIWKRDAEALWIAMGCVINAMLSTMLKKVLNHERPVTALRSDPGMPSSHAQSIFYAAVVAVLSAIQWHGVDIFTASFATLTLICGSYLSWLRISQKLHTTSQVLVGAATGSIFAVGWYKLWHSFVLRAFVASAWVRTIVVLCGLAFCIAFLFHVVTHWFTEERLNQMDSSQSI